MNKKILEKLKSVSVLLVEDDESLRMVVEESLKLWCKEVFTANNGDEGLEFFNKYKPDVVITDIHMPRMSGLKMAKKIREYSAEVPIVVITAYDTDDNMMGSIDIGSYTYLRKPVELDELMMTVIMCTRSGLKKERIDLGRGFLLDEQTKTLYCNDSPIDLTKKEFDLLFLLATKKGDTVTQEIIEYWVWEDKPMTTQTLRVHINNIRKKTYPELIRSVSGIGYKLQPQE